MRSLGHIEHFVAGAVGEPGRRTFLLEIGSGVEFEWFLVEKEQVAALAHRVLELLGDLGVPVVETGQDLTETQAGIDIK